MYSLLFSASYANSFLFSVVYESAWQPAQASAQPCSTSRRIHVRTKLQPRTNQLQSAAAGQGFGQGFKGAKAAATSRPHPGLLHCLCADMIMDRGKSARPLVLFKGPSYFRFLTRLMYRTTSTPVPLVVILLPALISEL